MHQKTIVETRRRISDQDKRRLSTVIYLTWLAIIAALISVILLAEYLLFKSGFQQTAQVIEHRLQSNIRQNEAVLEGFAAFLSQREELDDNSAVDFTTKIRQRFPHIFMMEVAESVRAEDLDRFVERQRKRGYPEYKVKAFDYGGGRDWRRLPEKGRYYPLVFLSPLSEESRSVLGLDLGSHKFLNDPMQRALRTGHYQSSLPFKLIEGADAFVMFMPVDGPEDTNTNEKPKFIVLIVLLIDRLLSSIMPDLEGTSEILIHHTDRPKDDPAGHLYSRSVPDRPYLFRASHEVELEAGRNGYVLSLTRYLYLTEISWVLIAMVIFGTSVIFLYSRGIIIKRYNRDLEWARDEARLQLLASYDALTDLPNRRFLVETLELNLKDSGGQLILALLYLDLDGFKEVNDRYGHKAGDTLLQQVASRIRNAVRNEDMAGRLGGDEFVVVLQNYTSKESVHQIVAKLRAEIKRPYVIEQRNIHIGVSIGVAFYPEDTADLLDLLHIADRAMYTDKRHRTTTRVLPFSS